MANIENFRFMRTGYTYKECESEGWGLPVTHSECDYRGSAKYNDLLEISAWVKSMKGVRLEIACEICAGGGFACRGAVIFLSGRVRF